jgi:hypothetical protein
VVVQVGPRRIIVVALLCAGGCTQDESKGEISTLRAKLTLEDAIDFGGIQIGSVATRVITIKNVGASVALISKVQPGDNFTTDGGAFSVPTESFAIAPSELHRLNVTFAPYNVATKMDSTIVLVTDIPDPQNPKALLHPTIKVTGSGASGLYVSPNPVDFGKVLRGSSKSIKVRVKNLLDNSIPLTTAVDASGRPDLPLVKGLGRFSITSFVGEGGSLLDLGHDLYPGEDVLVTLQYDADPQSREGLMDLAHWTIADCPSKLCQVTIDLLGGGTDRALDCTPLLNFAGVSPGYTRDAPITCKNIAAEPVIVEGWALETTSAPEFSVDPFPGMVPPVAPLGALEVMVHFAPTVLGQNPDGALVVSNKIASGVEMAPAVIDLRGHGGGPIAVLPADVNFGAIQVGSTHIKDLFVQNAGDEVLYIYSMTLVPATAFQVEPNERIGIAAGDSALLDLYFSPLGSVNGGVLLLGTNDGRSELQQVPLKGRGVFAPGAPACAPYIAPLALDFGVVRIGATAVQNLHIKSQAYPCGNIDNPPRRCICVFSVQDIAPDASPFAEADPKLFWTIPPDGTQDLAITFSPMGLGTVTASLTLSISPDQDGGPASSIPVNANTFTDEVIPLTGIGLGTTIVHCPLDQKTAPGASLPLPLDIDPVGNSITSIAWSITRAPPLGIGTPNQWTPSPPVEDMETFLPVVPGAYGIQVVVTDDTHDRFECNFTITATRTDGFRFQGRARGSHADVR